MHNQGIVDVDPETELLFMCHLSRINLLQPFDQRSTGSQNTTCNLIKHFPIPMVLILFFFFCMVAYLIVSSILQAYSNFSSSTCIPGKTITPLYRPLLPPDEAYASGVAVASAL